MPPFRLHYANSLVLYCKSCQLWDENQVSNDQAIVSSWLLRCEMFKLCTGCCREPTWSVVKASFFRIQVTHYGIPKAGYPHLTQFAQLLLRKHSWSRTLYISLPSQGDGEPANTAAWPRQRSEQRHPGWPAWWDEGEFFGFLCWDFHVLVCSRLADHSWDMIFTRCLIDDRR